MGDEDVPAVFTPCGFSEECIARFTRRGFDRHLLFLCQSANVCGTEFKFKWTVHCGASASLVFLCTRQAFRLRVTTVRQDRPPYSFVVVALHQSFNKPRIGIARSSA